jgi:hypothetical protein
MVFTTGKHFGLGYKSQRDVWVEICEGGRKSVVIIGFGLSFVVTCVQTQKQYFNIFKVKNEIGF